MAKLMNRVGVYAQDVKIPRAYFTARPSCDHCQTTRARRDTYIIQNVESGEFKQVGRACMKDYTKGLSAEAAASWVSLFDSLIEGETPDTTSNTRYYDTVEILATAISAVDTFGYVKAKNEYDEYNPNSTKSDVCDYLARDKYFLERAAKNGMTDPEQNKDRAKELISWALTNEEDYGYMTNLKKTHLHLHQNSLPLLYVLRDPVFFSPFFENRRTIRNYITKSVL